MMPTMTTTRSRRRDLVTAGVLGAALVTAFAITPGGARSGPLLCPFRAVTGWPCPLCGATRSWVDLAHGDLQSSFAMNPVGPLLFVGAVVVLGALITALSRGIPTDEVWRRARPWLLVTAAVVAAVGVVRMGGVGLGIWTWDG